MLYVICYIEENVTTLFLREKMIKKSGNSLKSSMFSNNLNNVALLPFVKLFLLFSEKII